MDVYIPAGLLKKLEKTFFPDYWVILKMGYGNFTTQKVFAGWDGNGNFLWKLSKGITKAKECDLCYVFENNNSGELYMCRKDSYGLGGGMGAIFSGFEKDIENSDNVSVEIVKEYGVRGTLLGA